MINVGLPREVVLWGNDLRNVGDLPEGKYPKPPKYNGSSYSIEILLVIKTIAIYLQTTIDRG